MQTAPVESLLRIDTQPVLPHVVLHAPPVTVVHEEQFLLSLDIVVGVVASPTTTPALRIIMDLVFSFLGLFFEVV